MPEMVSFEFGDVTFTNLPDLQSCYKLTFHHNSAYLQASAKAYVWCKSDFLTGNADNVPTKCTYMCVCIVHKSKIRIFTYV